MAVKTITVTVAAYSALKSLKGEHESFSDVILRVAKKRPLSDFIGILSKETGERLEKHIREKRKLHAELYTARIKRIRAELKGVHGTS